MPKLYPEDLKQLAISYRQQGHTYTEIQDLINFPIPKNTFTGWFKHITLSEESKRRIFEKMVDCGKRGLAVAWEVNQRKRQELLREIHYNVNEEMSSVTIDPSMAKIILSTLYLGEGGKTGEKISFGNSNPDIIRLFLGLFRKSFPLDESKFRGTILCRADQNIKALGKFWSEQSNIPLTQFYPTRIDSRTLGKPTLKADYKGVFVVEYFSNKIFLELRYISDILYTRVM